MNAPADRPPLPDAIRDVAHLEELLSEPHEYVIDTVRQLVDGDFIVLGAAGKMGPTLSRMLRRALDLAGRKSTRVMAVSRFSSPDSQRPFLDHAIETAKADLLNPDHLAALPDATNVIYMAGMKFGSTGQEALTWAMNTFLPGMVCQKFRRSRIAAFSTGNIYGLVPVTGGGSVETDPLEPMGDYAMSCVGRERMFEHFSRALNIPVSIIRLNYAIEMRYGVIQDIGSKVQRGEPVDVSMGNANVIWQGDANAMSIASLAHAASPPFVLNVSGPEIISIRRVAEEFGRLLGREPRIIGSESGTALLNNGQLGHRLFGYPGVPVQQVIQWTADWLKRGGTTHNKPTHFETRDGKF
jgi:nucleoside-diphosphate-sugar epimerase